MAKVSLSRHFVVIALIMVASNLIHPVTPAMLQELGMPDYTFGLLFAGMSFTYFLFCPLWGAISERIGRVPVLAISTGGYAVGQLLFMLSSQIGTMLGARLFAGIFSGGYMVAGMAYVVDQTTPENRGKYMSYYAAFRSVSTAAGFLIGGVIGDYSISAVFVAQIILLVMVSVGVGFYLGEARRNPEGEKPMDRRELIRSANPFKAFMQAGSIMTLPFAFFLFITFLTSFATTDYDNAFNYYVRDVLHFSTAYNGYIKAAFGIIGLVSNFTINMWITRKTDGRKSIVTVLALCGISLFATLVMPGVASFIVMNIIFYTFNIIYIPIQQALAVKDQEEKNTGIVSGIFNSMQSMGMIAGSLFAGFIYTLGPKYPFVFGAAAFLVCALLSGVNYFQYKNTKKTT